MGKFGGIGIGGDVADHDEGALGEGGFDSIGIGHADHGVGVDDPDGLDLARGDGAEHIDGFEAGFIGDVRAGPEGLDGGAVGGVFQFQMAGKHVGQSAHLAPAHGVGLAGDGEWPHAGATNAAGGEVAVEDGVDLVGAGVRLVDALGIDGDGLFGGGPEVAEVF